MAKAFYIPAPPVEVITARTKIAQVVELMMLLLLIQQAEQSSRSKGLFIDIHFQNVSFNKIILVIFLSFC